MEFFLALAIVFCAALLLLTGYLVAEAAIVLSKLMTYEVRRAARTTFRERLLDRIQGA